ASLAERCRAGGGALLELLTWKRGSHGPNEELPRRLYPHRAIGGYRHHRDPGRDPISRLRAGPGEGPTDRLPFQYEADWHRSDDVRPGLRRDLPLRLLRERYDERRRGLGWSALALYQDQRRLRLSERSVHRADRDHPGLLRLQPEPRQWSLG